MLREGSIVTPLHLGAIFQWLVELIDHTDPGSAVRVRWLIGSVPDVPQHASGLQVVVVFFGHVQLPKTCAGTAEDCRGGGGSKMRAVVVSFPDSPLRHCFVLDYDTGNVNRSDGKNLRNTQARQRNHAAAS